MRGSIIGNLAIQILVVLNIAKSIDSKRILSIEFVGTKSHVITFVGLLEELSRRGHDVTLVSPLPVGYAKANVHQLQAIDFDKLTKSIGINLFEMKEKGQSVNPFALFPLGISKACSDLMKSTDLQKILEQHWDLIILQPLFNDCGLGYIHLLMKKSNAALILFVPASAPPFIVSPLGGHHPPSFVPNFLSDFSDEMTFVERMKNLAAEISMYLTFNYYYIPKMTRIYREALGEDLPEPHQILSSASLIFENSHFSTGKHKPNLPHVIQVGGIHSIVPTNPLPKELEDFVAGSGKDGFILFSLGSALESKNMPEEKRTLILNVLGKLKQRVIWKYEADGVPNVPKNVLLNKWLPQQDILGHPKIRMFITHCGLGGIEESLYHGVPLLGIPFFGDQPMNAKVAAAAGYLYQLDWLKLTEENFYDGIQEVLNNPKYRETVGNISTAFKDQIDSPLNRAVWWTEYVMRHKGAKLLQSGGRKLNTIQYFSLDVIFTYLLILFVIIAAFCKILKSICCKASTSKNESTKFKKH